MRHRKLSDAAIERLVPAKCVVMANADTDEYFFSQDAKQELTNWETLVYSTIGADEVRVLFKDWREIPAVLTYTGDENEQGVA